MLQIYLKLNPTNTNIIPVTYHYAHVMLLLQCDVCMFALYIHLTYAYKVFFKFTVKMNILNILFTYLMLLILEDILS